MRRAAFGFDAEDLPSLVEASDQKAIQAFEQLVRLSLGRDRQHGDPLQLGRYRPLGGARLGDFLLRPIEQAVQCTAVSISGRNVAFLPAAAVEAEAIGTVYVCMGWVRGRSSSQGASKVKDPIPRSEPSVLSRGVLTDSPNR